MIIQTTAASNGGCFVCGAALRKQEAAAGNRGGFFVSLAARSGEARSLARSRTGRQNPAPFGLALARYFTLS
jgi:hypothetical protein